MKRFFAVIIALAMVVSMSACSLTVTVTEDDKQLVMGTVVDNTYENEFLGIGCKLDSDWTFLTEEEIREYNNMAADMTDEEYREYLDSAQVIYDMMASNANGTDSINLNIEKVSTVNNILFSAEEYLKNSEETTVEALKSMGYEEVNTTYGEVNIDGKAFDTLFYECTYSTITVYMCSICLEVGDYIAAITVSSLTEDGMNATVDALYLL